MNLGVTSNYVWRGVTQTDDKPAISGGVDWSGDSGLYAGAWASNVDFGSCCETTYELDLYGGYKGEISDFGYDAGLIYYTYDPDDDANFLELALSGSWKFLSAGLNYTLDGEADDDTGAFVSGDLYYYGAFSYDLPQDFNIGLTLGRYDFENDGVGEIENYGYYQVDLGKSAGDYGDVTLSYSDTNMDDDSGKVFVSWAKTF
jgi:uncharacterized protein (TIGR02001 family)